jgi:hypothetical protein
MMFCKKMGLTVLPRDTLHTTLNPRQGEWEFRGLIGDFPLTICEYSEISQTCKMELRFI